MEQAMKSNASDTGSSSEEDESNITLHNYRYELDRTTGTLVLMEEEDQPLDLNLNEQFSAPTAAAGDSNDNDDDENENLACLKVLESGEMVLLTPLDNEGNNAVTTLAEDQSEIKMQGESEKTDFISVVTIANVKSENEDGLNSNSKHSDGVSSSQSQDLIVQEGGQLESREAISYNLSYWSSDKVEDLLHCIRRHSRKFRRKTASKMQIWRDISKDMTTLGHTTNKDECSKKWWNLYRTWKLIQSRPDNPNDLRRLWPYHALVTHVVKLLSSKYSQSEHSASVKRIPTSTSLKKKSKNVIKRLLEHARAQQEALSRAEAEFQAKVKELDKERDELVADIEKALREKAEKLGSAAAGSNKSNESEIINNLNSLISASQSSRSHVEGEPMFYIEIPEGSSTEEIVALLNASSGIQNSDSGHS